MGYLRKTEVLDVIHEDLCSSLACYDDFKTKSIVEFCYQSVEREIDKLPQISNAIEAFDNQKWHSCDEEPKEGSYIVAWLPVGIDSKADTPHYYAIWDYENESWNIDVPTVYEGMEINLIAWMPIPKPYIIN